jgi:hypothetical protein
MARPDFENVWGSTNAPFTEITDTDYKAGWVFRTGAPPRRVNFDYFQNLSDQRHQWLGEQMLQTVGHDWQDDVKYDAYAVTRSPMDGRLYRSLTAGNIGNEPSASGAQWALGVVEQETVPESILTSGIAGSFSSLKAFAPGTSATVTVTADAICLKNAASEQVVINSVAVAPSIAASGVNGLDSGTSSASTWYSLWVIWNGSTVAGLLSLSATAPTLPAGYTHKARVGWIRTDATANKFPLGFTQAGKNVRYKLLAGSNLINLPVFASGILGNVVTPTYSAASVANFVPPTASIAHVTATGGLQGVAMVAPSPSYGSYNSSNPPPIATLNPTTGQYTPVSGALLLESSSLYVASTAGSASFNIYGWEDNL